MPKSKNNDKNNDAFKLIESSGNVFEDLGFGQESANLLLRADLMITITDTFDSHNWSNAEAAEAIVRGSSWRTHAPL